MTMAVVSEARPTVVDAVMEAERRSVAVSILIVTWNSAPWIERCLTSIEAAAGDLPCEVLIFDNASTDETQTLIRRHTADHVTVIESDVNLGFSGAMNRLIEQSSGAYLLCLNADSEPEPDCIAKLVNHLDAHPDVAAAAPLLSHHDGEPQNEWQLRTLPSLRSIAAEVLLLNKVFPANGWSMGHAYRSIDLDDVQRVEQPAAAALLLRRSVVQTIGAFDETFEPAWFEDVDYCRRMANAGLPIDLVPSARAHHFGGASLQKMPFDEFIAIWYRNLFRYVTKWFSTPQAEIVRWMIIVGMVARIIATTSFIVRPPVARRVALRGYSTVLQEALARWSGTSRSSS